MEFGFAKGQTPIYIKIISDSRIKTLTLLRKYHIISMRPLKHQIRREQIHNNFIITIERI